MNDLNQLENQLRSWIPRPPSARHKPRLFGWPEPVAAAAGSGRADEAAAALRLVMSWLTPALALLMLSLILFGRSPRGWTQFISSPPISMVATVALSQPHLAPYCAAAQHGGYNVWPVTTFEWTKGGPFLTTPPSVFNINRGRRWMTPASPGRGPSGEGPPDPPPAQ